MTPNIPVILCLHRLVNRWHHLWLPLKFYHVFHTNFALKCIILEIKSLNHWDVLLAFIMIWLWWCQFWSFINGFSVILEVPKENEGSSSPEPDWKDEQSVMSDLTCVAIFAVEDPIRDEVAMMLHSIFVIQILWLSRLHSVADFKKNHSFVIINYNFLTFSDIFLY